MMNKTRTRTEAVKVLLAAGWEIEEIEAVFNGTAKQRLPILPDGSPWQVGSPYRPHQPFNAIPVLNCRQSQELLNLTRRASDSLPSEIA